MCREQSLNSTEHTAVVYDVSVQGHQWKKQVGVEDMVLIQKISESAIVDNLRKRFMEDCIYVSEQTALSGDDNRTSLSRQLVECFSGFDPENTLKT